MPALDVIIVSHGDGKWLGPCLRSLEANRGACEVKVIIVENGPEEPTWPPEILGARNVTLLRSENRGFAAGNNLGLRHSNAEFVLFLNPDTEFLSGTLADAVTEMSSAPDVGMLAVRQIKSDGSLYPSIRRFPNAARALFDAFGLERIASRTSCRGERDLNLPRYANRVEIDWTTGAVLFVRREALNAVGDFDESYFLFSEETDLARRIKNGGWSVIHSPVVQVVHHIGKAGVVPRREAQMAYARMQYARRHFSPAHRLAYWAILILHHAIRVIALNRGTRTESSTAEASWACLQVLLLFSPPPYGADANVLGQKSPIVEGAGQHSAYIRKGHTVLSHRKRKGLRTRLRVALYHHVADDPTTLADRLDVTIAPRLFEEHMAFLARNYDVVSLDDVLSGKLPGKPLLITFDDGYRSVLDTAAPVLAHHGLPSVLFVSEAFIGDALPLDCLISHLSHSVPYEELARAVTPEGRAAANSVAEVLGQSAEVPGAARVELARTLCERYEVNMAELRSSTNLFMSRDHLRQLSRARIEIGNHTRSHLHCRVIADEDLAYSELVGHKDELERISGEAVRSFSYPYGSRVDATALVERVLMRSGHQARFLVEAIPNRMPIHGPINRVSLKRQPAARLPVELDVLPAARAIARGISRGRNR